MRYYFSPSVTVAKSKDSLLVKTPERVFEIKGSSEFQAMLRDGLNETGVCFPKTLDEEHGVLVKFLRSEGVLVATPNEQDALFGAIGFGTQAAEERSVCFSGDPLIVDPLQQQFEDIGGHVVASETADVWVFGSATNNQEEMLTFNRKLLQARKIGLVIVASGNEFRIGPAIEPHVTACEDCVRHRINAASRDPDKISLFGDVSWGSRPSRAAVQAATAFGAALIAHLVFRREDAAYNRFYVGNVLKSAFKEHQVLKIPRCPSCGVTSGGEYG
ncbi:TOMM precursor leader peptide-binding protein [Agrobacterium sp. CCNWLW71]|uniref:TOMM precursor leader peptide-binding protein n=1 Tax=unclassified Agrobacterium TaxID=2632611 RepID=UPI002FF29178